MVKQMRNTFWTRFFVSFSSFPYFSVCGSVRCIKLAFRHLFSACFLKIFSVYPALDINSWPRPWDTAVIDQPRDVIGSNQPHVGSGCWWKTRQWSAVCSPGRQCDELVGGRSFERNWWWPEDTITRAFPLLLCSPTSPFADFHLKVLLNAPR